MKSLRFFSLIGMAGVSSHEAARAKHWEKRFNVALVLVVFLALIAWYDNNHGQLLFSVHTHLTIDWIIWGFFTGELLIMLLLVNDRKHYLQHNWFNLAVIITAMPLLWDQHSLGGLRAIRFLVITMKLLHLSTTLRSLLSRNHLGITVVACWLFAICSGIMMAAIDPAINNIWDGIWWAWVTVTTVGYGDVVPVSGPGRILAGILMLLGMGLFSLFTANFSAFLVSKQEEKLVEKEQEVLDRESEVLKGEERIISHLERIESRLKKLEDKMDTPIQ